MHSLVQSLIEEERRIGANSAPQYPAAFRVCEKLRQPLASFAGVAGYRSLLSRALILARAEAPLLEGVRIKPDGLIHFLPELEPQLTTDEAAMAGEALARHLLELLAVFIGEALTLRLVRDVWPKAAFAEQPSPRKNP